MNVKALADALGVTPRTVNAWENESNNNLPSRDKLFHYLSLLFEGRELAEPAQFIEISKIIDSLDKRHKPKKLSGFFVRLSPQNRSIVNVLVRTLYRAQTRQKQQGGPTQN